MYSRGKTSGIWKETKVNWMTAKKADDKRQPLIGYG
jgi:hypothetical protein